MIIALNNAARFPANKMIRVRSPNVEFLEEEMADVILANALKSQVRSNISWLLLMLAVKKC